MRVQIIADGKGNNTGVFIPLEDWTLIKSKYPDIDQIDADIPDWQKSLLDKRLTLISGNKNHLLPIENLYDELNF